MSDDRFGIDEPQPSGQTSMLSGCLKGCLIVGVIGLIVAAIGIYWISQNWRGVLADFGTGIVEAVIEESELPDQEKSEIMEQFNRIAGAFREGELSGEQLALVIEQVAESPLLPSIVVQGINRKYFANSGLTEEEKEAGRTALNRFVRGMIDEKISEDSFEQAMSKIAVKQADEQWEFKDSVTDEELRELIQFLKEKADAAEIPEVIDEVDPSDEMKRIIDSALDEGVANTVEEDDAPREIELE